MSIRFVPPQGYVSPCAREERPVEFVEPRPRRPWGVALRWAAAVVVTSVVVGLVVPVLDRSVQARRREACVENLRRIGEALLQYEKRWGVLPPSAVAGPNGEPLLSWRVAILPELGFGSLHAEFRPDEPWDGPHNRPLIGRMPEVFRCPASHGHPGSTCYLALHGPQALFDGRAGVAIASVTDGTSQTLMVAEASRGVAWTQPTDHEYAPLDLSSSGAQPLPKFGSGHSGGFYGLFGDGWTRFLRDNVREETLRALITRDGGEAVSES
jgi:hypothetical protein